MERRKQMHSLILKALVAMALTGAISAGPDIAGKGYDTVRIVSPQSKELARSSDPDAIAFLMAAMKRAKSAGSNTYGLSLTSIISFSSPDSRRPAGDGGPKLMEVSDWYFDLNSGHFAGVSPPKLVLYQFTKDDLPLLRKKLKIAAEQVAPSAGDKPPK